MKENIMAQMPLFDKSLILMQWDDAQRVEENPLLKILLPFVNKLKQIEGKKLSFLGEITSIQQKKESLPDVGDYRTTAIIMTVKVPEWDNQNFAFDILPILQAENIYKPGYESQLEANVGRAIKCHMEIILEKGVEWLLAYPEMGYLEY
jgi:hypothetical protein